MWRRMKPLTPAFFVNYWSLIEPMIDQASSTYAEWGRNKGMRHRMTGREHGIVRWINAYGSIFERTMKDGKINGFSREIYHNSVTLAIYEDGKCLGTIHFDHDFKETERSGEQIQLLA